MRRPISSKSKTCTESMYVYTADISVKVSVHYPGRSVNLPSAMVIVKSPDELAEVSRGHSTAYRPCPRAERLEVTGELVLR